MLRRWRLWCAAFSYVASRRDSKPCSCVHSMRMIERLFCPELGASARSPISRGATFEHLPAARRNALSRDRGLRLIIEALYFGRRCGQTAILTAIRSGTVDKNREKPVASALESYEAEAPDRGPRRPLRVNGIELEVQSLPYGF